MLRYLFTLIALLTFTSSYSQVSFDQSINTAKSISDDTYEQIAALEDILRAKKYTSYLDSLGLVHYAIAFRYRNEGDDINVIKHAKQGVDLFLQSSFDAYQLPFLYSFLGESHSQVGAIDSALFYYQQILNLEPQGRALTVYGYAAFQISEFYRQVEDYQSALDIIQYVTNGPYVAELSPYDLMDLYLNESICHSNIDKATAIEDAQQSLLKAKDIITNEIKEIDPLQALELDAQEAYLLLKMDKKDAASSLCKQSLSRLTAYDMSDPYANAEAANAAGNISYTYQQSGSFDDALSFARTAQAIFKSYGDPSFLETEFSIQSNLANSYAGIGALDSALNYIDYAINTLSSQDNEKSQLKRLALEAYYDKALIHQTAFNITNNKDDLHKGIQAIYALDTLMDDHVADQLSSYSVRNIKSKASQYYKLGIDIAYRLNDVDAYWYFSEKSKGLQLLEANLANQTKSKSKTDLQLGNVKRSILELEYLIERSDIKTYIDSLKVVLANLKKQRIDLNQKSKSERKVEINIKSITNLQLHLGDKNLLQYQAGDSTLYGMLITSETTQLISLGHLPSINKKVRALRELIQDPDSDMSTMASISTDLYNLLIKPFDITSNRLVVIPDEALFFLPLDVLVNSAGQYVIEDKTISYAISGSFYHIDRKGKRRFKEISLIQPDYNAAGSFAPLPFASAELQAISEVFSIAKSPALLSKPRLDSIFSLAGVFHYSGHAIANMGSGEQAYLAIGDREDIANRLLLGELYTMTTDAQMVVLSACNTGIGQILKGEGVESLTRGFMYAGAHAVVNTLWTVDDQSTSTIIGGLYSYLGEDNDKDQALRQAKLDYITGAEAYQRHPYYWAGIVAVGDMSPLEPFAIDWIKHIFILLAFIGLAWFLTWRYNKKPFPKIEFLMDDF